ncbi:hypothetical protein ACJJTC_018960 [Scirpophaga incertulas]
MEEEIRFITNQKGQSTLIRGVNRYNKHKTNKSGSTLWRCINRRECSASLSLDITGKIVKKEARHTCKSNDVKNIIHDHIEYLKQAVCKDLRPIQKIFEENEKWYPKLSPTLLSCAGQRHRTTNALEGWHRRINTGRIPKKPSVYMFVFKLKKESKFWDRKIRDGLFKKMRCNRRQKDIYFDQNYNNLLQKLECNRIGLQQFLKKIIFLQLYK